MKSAAWRIAGYLPVVARGCDWDWATPIDLLAYSLTRLANHVESHRMHVGWERDVRRMRICVEALRRVSADSMKGWSYEPWGVFPWCDHKREDRALDGQLWLATELLRKHLRSWWC